MQILRLLVSLYQNLGEPDYFSICQCQMHLDDHGRMPWRPMNRMWYDTIYLFISELMLQDPIAAAHQKIRAIELSIQLNLEFLQFIINNRVNVLIAH